MNTRTPCKINSSTGKSACNKCENIGKLIVELLGGQYNGSISLRALNPLVQNDLQALRERNQRVKKTFPLGLETISELKHRHPYVLRPVKA